jgi:hypothetical protein
VRRQRHADRLGAGAEHREIFCGGQRGYTTPVAIERVRLLITRRIVVRRWRKRVRNRMKTRGLSVCDRTERSWRESRKEWPVAKIHDGLREEGGTKRRHNQRPRVKYYRIRYYISSEKLQAVDCTGCKGPWQGKADPEVKWTSGAPGEARQWPSISKEHPEGTKGERILSISTFFPGETA